MSGKAMVNVADRTPLRLKRFTAHRLRERKTIQRCSPLFKKDKTTHFIYMA